MTRKCVMWSVGPRVHGGPDICGNSTDQGWYDPRQGDLVPICRQCSYNLNYPKEIIEKL